MNLELPTVSVSVLLYADAFEVYAVRVSVNSPLTVMLLLESTTTAGVFALLVSTQYH